MRRHSLGFTMVEMMLVLLLLGIILAVAVPSINRSLDEIKLDGAAREAVHAIQYSQSLSIKEGAAYGVKFNKPLNKFNCYINAPGNVIINPVEKKPYVVDLRAKGPLQGVDIVSATFAANNDWVEFNALGEPNSSGTVVLALGGIQKTINVTAPIGRISVN